MSDKPMPCPFCGSERILLSMPVSLGSLVHFNHWYARCTDCYAQGSHEDTRDQSIARWNAAGQDTIILWKLLAAIVLYRYWFDTCSKTAAPNWELLAGDASEKLDTALELADKAVGASATKTTPKWRWIDECMNAEGRQG